MEELFLAAIGLVVVCLLVASPILALVAYVRSRRFDDLAGRINRLETTLRSLAATPGAEVKPTAPLAPAPAPIARPKALVEAPADAMLVDATPTSARRNLIGWEFLIGRTVLGWAAVVVLIFATGFFLRYAFGNHWIGPVGQIALGVAGGLALLVAGGRFERSGRRVFAQMLSAAGIVLLYLATYSAFGFYHLIDQRAAGVFLLVLVVESALLALRHEAPAIAIMAVVGGLLTPLLMHSDRDQYVSLFLYLSMLNAGVVGLMLMRAWPVIGTLSLAGTHGLFWAWFAQNYHPEKLPWALAFPGVIYLLYLVQTMTKAALRPVASWEDQLVMPLNVVLWSAAGYMLLVDDYRAWLATLAIAMALVYAAAGRLLLAVRCDTRLVITAIAIAAGFVALAIPLEAGAAWVAVGWACEAGVLWWFGLRVKLPSLRFLAAAFAGAAVVRMLFYEGFYFDYTALMPILNRYALSALAATACLITALVTTRRFLPQISLQERALVAMAAVGCVLLVWWIVTTDLNTYFDTRAYQGEQTVDWHRLGQMTLSAWWAVYATVILLLGFRARQGLLRWTALGLFGVTVIKVFFWDMAGLDEIYRIVAFFVLAVLLGGAAWVYQRVQPSDELQGDKL